MKKIKREDLKNKVNEIAPKLPEDMVFIAGVRAIKDGQIQVEFVQNRSLAGRKVSMLALLNEGDKRFNTGKTLMRVWSMVNVEGFKSTFGIDLTEAKTMAATAGEDEVIGLFMESKTVNVNGIVHPIKIVCRETIDIQELPKSIREQLEDMNVTDEIKNRYILQTATGDQIVDEYGNKIYRRYELSYGEDTDVLVENKILTSELAKRSAGIPKQTADDLLKNVLNG